MLTDCDKCKSYPSEVRLDPDDHKRALCVKCKAEIPLSDFFKNMMKQRNEFIEKNEIMLPPNGVKFICDNKKCSKPFSAEVRKSDNKVYCSFCNEVCNVSNITIAMLKENNVFEGYTKDYFENEREYNSEARESREIQKVLDSQNMQTSIEDTKVSVIHLGTVDKPVTQKALENATKKALAPPGKRGRPKKIVN
jgi:hypothetical protein